MAGFAAGPLAMLLAYRAAFHLAQEAAERHMA